MKRGGGFVPNEVRYPGPLTQPYACTLAGAQTSSHRAPISPPSWRREEAHDPRSSLPQGRGVTPHFSWNGTAVRRRRGERAAPMQGRESGPGYLTSLGTEPPLYFKRTLRHRSSQARQNVFACGGGQQTSDAQLSKGPAKSELVPAWAPLARLLSNQVRPHSLKMGRIPITR